MLLDASVTATVATGTAATEIVAEPDFPSDVAVIEEVPTANPDTTPLALMEATPVSLDAQVIVLPARTFPAHP